LRSFGSIGFKPRAKPFFNPQCVGIWFVFHVVYWAKAKWFTTCCLSVAYLD
jgi:hypothetical protein